MSKGYREVDISKGIDIIPIEEGTPIKWIDLNPRLTFESTLKHKHTITVVDTEKEYGLEKRIQKTKKSFIEAWEEHFVKELTDQINKDVEKIQKEICPSCLKKIGLVESNDHDSLCKECYWEGKQ